MKKNLLYYILLIGVFVLLIWRVIEAGKGLAAGKGVAAGGGADAAGSGVASGEGMWAHFAEHLHSPLGLLLMQIIVILFVSRIFGRLFTKLRQPSVVGEMIAGIFLGPSIMGYFFPGFSEFLFPLPSLNNLQFLSQLGLILFMFIIGMELDIDKLKNKAHNAIVISHASIVFPYFLGVSVAYFLFEQYAPAQVSFVVFALFMGIAISITAFPVLARILQERKLTRTSLGAIVISCAAFDDVSAWCILATVIAVAKSQSLAATVITIALTIVFIFTLLYVVSPWLKRLSAKNEEADKLSPTFTLIVFLVMLLSACITEAVGIHALFGAFLAGVCMPANATMKRKLMDKIEDVSLLLLLPLFFAFTGLRTQIGLLNEGDMWGACGLIVFVAIMGKFGGSTLAAKITGQSWRDALSIGALMNTRGLMELIVLNIGYDLGILTPSLFAIMVIMALSTTFMTGPLLDLINYFSDRSKQSRPT